MKNFSTKALFIGIVLVLLLISYIMYRNLESYNEEVEISRHSHDIVMKASTVLSTLKDAETGHRGYLLTYDSAYLTPYFNAVEVLPFELKSLDSVLGKGPEQRRNFDTLKNLVRDQFLVISNLLAVTTLPIKDIDTFDNAYIARGKVGMDKIRKLIDRIIEKELSAINSRTSDETWYRKVTPLVLLGYTIVALACVVSLFQMVMGALGKREKAEKELKENLKQLEIRNALVEERKLLLNEAEPLAQMGSWLWRNDKELVWTDGLYKIFGIEVGAPVTWRSFVETVLPEDRGLLEGFLNNIKDKPSGTQLDFRISVDREVRHLYIRSKTIKTDVRGSKEVLGTVLDVTARKEYEMKLQSYNKELKRSNEDLEQFAYVASHDMQEPLRKIRAFGDRLEVKYKSKLDLQGKDYIRRMQVAATRMQTMIEDLLTFSRISLEEKNVEFLEPDIILDELKDELEILLKQQKAKIHYKNLPSFVGVRGQVKRLFQNLIVNAIKFHKENVPPIIEITGEDLLTIRVKEELGIVLPGSECVRLCIKDNGIGFDEKYSERIFTIFQRLHTRSAYEGTGIGLAICRKIVTNHDGFITAFSQIGVGSEFIIILPKS